jgi:hypothetical protein
MTVSPADHPTDRADLVDFLHDAWSDYGDRRSMTAINELSAMVSTNRVFRVEIDDGSHVVAKVSSYGSYFLFLEDHDRIHRCAALLRSTRYAGFLADVLERDGRAYSYYEGTTWCVFYAEVERRDQLPRVLDDGQVDNFGEEIALFHRECAAIAGEIPLTSKSIKSDAIHLLDLLSNPHSAAQFGLPPSDLDVLRRHTHEFLERLEAIRYDYWAKQPVLIDWNLGNFSVEFEPGRRRFRLFSRWDYDWFRIEPRLLDFYFLSRVSSRTGDRTHFTYLPHTLTEPRFVRFLRAYHRVFPLSEEELLFCKEVFRFFVLNYVVREGDAFFRPEYGAQLRRDVVHRGLPALERLDLRPLLELVDRGA